MFLNTVQPETVSLFSSTGSDPLGLFGTACDSALPSDSFIHLLVDKSSLPEPAPPATPICLPQRNEKSDDTESSVSGLDLNQTVLHIQSPTIRTTYIRCPPTNSTQLGLKHPWIHIQVRDLGRDWSFEIGLVDRSSRVGVVRLSTFQKTPRLYTLGPSSPPLLHLPLSFPPISSRPLTAWATVTLHLPTLIAHFSSSATLPRGPESSSELGGALHTGASVLIPTPSFSHTSHVKVYATCRLRRIWFTQRGPSKPAPWEFELYGDEFRE
ncbi:hypothetical protein FB45DRAFT_1056614 [Roridomyces roridus]|uniref:CFA20 domain-containing protein n=1 Tax=Roridomyces roridus TaxID=1738132 RepID=A0AAD7BYY3_9AGAR|nr:hypothetical protein FB45DRAFT_1056614 [Roridomyces roridus]